MQEPLVFVPDAYQKENKIKTFFKKYWKILVVLLVILGLAMVVGFLLQQKKQTPISTVQDEETSIEEDASLKTWQLTLQFYSNNNSLSLKNLELVPKRITTDFRSAAYSSYTLMVLDGQDKSLFMTKVHINEFALYNLSAETSLESTGITMPTAFETIVFIPYYEAAKRIVILKESDIVLQVNLPKELVKKQQDRMVGIEKAYAETSSCRPLQVVFISDGYTNFDLFRTHAESAKRVIESTEPFASLKPSILDFKTLDNRESLGCSSGFLTCVFNRRVVEIGKEKFPNASKFLILTTARESGKLGVAQFLGDVGVVSTGSTGFEYTAVHEFLGHTVSGLYDRYVMKGSNYDFMDRNVQSNCSIGSSGSDFWKNVGVTTGYLGCMNQIYYAPSQASCSSGRSDVASMGTPDSIMSGGGCGGSHFDKVEQEWIKTQILPLYTSCRTGGGVPTPTSSSSRGMLPTITQQPSYICEPDPKCVQKKDSLQLCQLVCRKK